MKVVLAGAELEESLALRSLWSALEAAGHEVRLVVFNEPAELEAAAAAIAASRAELAGLSMVFTRRAREFVELATRARELGFRGHLTAGGHFAAFNAVALLGEVEALDSVVTSEGEEILVDLAAHLDEPREVRGLVLREAGGRVVRTEPARKPPDLDALPPPRHRRPYDEYLGFPIANLLASRGCTHRCSFCSIAAWHGLCGGPRLRLRSAEAVADEVAELYEDGVRIFNFHDDNFLLRDRAATARRLDELEGALRRRGVSRIAFAIKARPDEVDPALFARLVRMGLFRVFLGIEAGTDEALAALGRGQSLADNERALATTGRLGLHACWNLLLWGPTSTLEDVARSVEFLARHPGNPMNFCRTEVYAGTPLEARLRREGRLLGDMYGLDYRIADPRAEASFQAAYMAFRERCFGDEGLHHLSMRVDYEHQVLAHFLGVDEGLRREVKGFVVEVNRDTARLLARVIDEIARRWPLGEEEARALGLEVGEEVTARGRLLGGRGRQLLAVIAEARALRRGRRLGPLAQRAAAAGLAAALSLGGAGCPGEGRDGSHATEMAPPPTLPDSAGEVSRDAGAADAAPRTAATGTAGIGARDGGREVPAPLATGRPDAIRPAFDALALPGLAAAIRPPRDVTVELRIAPDGRVTDAIVGGAGVPEGQRERAVAALSGLTFPAAETGGMRFVLTLRADELARAAAPRAHTMERAPEPPRPPRPPTHMHERAPAPTHIYEEPPPPPPPTHMREMAPPPPPTKKR